MRINRIRSEVQTRSGAKTIIKLIIPTEGRFCRDQHRVAKYVIMLKSVCLSTRNGRRASPKSKKGWIEAAKKYRHLGTYFCH